MTTNEISPIAVTSASERNRFYNQNPFYGAEDFLGGDRRECPTLQAAILGCSSGFDSARTTCEPRPTRHRRPGQFQPPHLYLELRRTGSTEWNSSATLTPVRITALVARARPRACLRDRLLLPVDGSWRPHRHAAGLRKSARYYADPLQSCANRLIIGAPFSRRLG
jgi:hypothetical protein